MSPTYELKCKRCGHEFEKELRTGYTVLKHATSHYNSENHYYADGKEISKKKYEKCFPEYKIKKMWCPKCWWRGKSKIVRRSWCGHMVYDDNIRPGSGFSAVDRRHQDGIYWDQSSASTRKAEELNKELREEGKRKAMKIKERDEAVIKKTYRKVGRKEAIDLLKNPKRNRDVAVINEEESY